MARVAAGERDPRVGRCCGGGAGRGGLCLAWNSGVGRAAGLGAAWPLAGDRGKPAGMERGEGGSLLGVCSSPSLPCISWGKCGDGRRNVGKE